MSRQTIEEEFKRPVMNEKSNKRLNSNQSVNSHVTNRTSTFVGATHFGNEKKDSNKSIANILKLDNDKMPIDISIAQHLLAAPQKRRRSKRNSIHVINSNNTNSILGVDSLSVGAQRIDSTPGNPNDLRLIAPSIKVQRPSSFRRNSARHSPDAKLENAGTNFFNIVAQTANANRAAMQMIKNTRSKQKAKREDRGDENSSSSHDEIMIVHQMTQPIDLNAHNDQNNQNLELNNNSNFNFDQEILTNQVEIPSIQTPFTQKGPPIKKDSSEQFVDRFIQQFQPLNRDQEQQMREDRKYRQNMRNLESQIMVNYKINKKIASMDIEDVNRNTRFFRDYIKDQLKTTKKVKKHFFDTSNEPKLDRQDSLTEKIQQESNAFIRRMSYKGQSKRNEILKKERMLKLGKVKSQKQNLPVTQTNVRNTLNTTSNPNPEGPSQNLIDDEQSCKFTTNEDSYNQRANIQRQDQKSINATIPEGQTEEEDELEEINEEQIRKIDNQRLYRYLIYPDSQLRSIVDGASFIFLLMISLYVPFIISFNIASSLAFNYFEVLIDLWFIMEIFMNFFTGFYERGALVMNRKKIIKNYLQGWFIIDLFSSMPISFLDIALYEEESQGGSFSVYQSAKLIRILRMARYARLLRLLRFIKANKLLLTMEVVIVSEHANLLIRFLKISIILTFITHWISCILYLIGSSQLEDTGKSWLLIYKLQDSSVAEIYVNCLYWAFTTMCTVGYGDFHPVTSYERLISIFCMLISSGMFAYVIGDIGRMVSSHNLLAAQFREKMIYVDKFLRLKEIPINLRQQVKRYLEYNWALKKIYKIEESEVLQLMNDNLRGKITVYFNGRILQNIEVLCKFPIEFLSNLSFILQKQTYAIDDNLIVEKESGNEIFFMVSGKVSVIHRHTKTHITDLYTDSYFGEISFFSELQRSATVTARDFTEVLVLKREDFLLMAVKISQEALDQYHKIRESLSYGKRDYKLLSIKCYICYAYGHIALDCKQFNRLKGNLKRYYKKLYKRSIEDSISDSEDYRRQNPLVVSLESNQENNAEAQKQLRKNRQKAKREEKRRKSIAKRQSISSAATGQTPIRFDQHFQENSIKDIVLYPLEMQDQINKSDEDSILQNSSFKKQFTNRKTFASLFHKNTKNSSLLNTSEHSLHHQPSRGPRNFDNIFEPNDSENAFQFDRENRGNTIRNKKDRMNFDNEIMEIQEEDDEEDFEEEKQQKSEDIQSFSPSTPQSSRNSDNDSDRELLTQRVRMVNPKPPKGQNELTKRVGKNKRFSSKQKRKSDAEINNSVKGSMSKRQITIMPIKDIKKEVETVVKKTLTTQVEIITKKEVEYGKGGRPMKNVRKSNNNSTNSGTSGGQSHDKNQEEGKSPFKQFERGKEPYKLNIRKISTKLAIGNQGRNKLNDEVITKDESFQSGLKHLQSKSINDSYGEIATHRPTAIDLKNLKRKLSKNTNLKVSEDDYDFKSSESRRYKHGYNQSSKQNSKNSKFKNQNVQRDSLMIETDSNEELKEDHPYFQKSSRITRTHSKYEQQTEQFNTLLLHDQNQFMFYENQSKNKERRESSLEEQIDEMYGNKSSSRKFTKQFTPSKNNP